MSEYFEFNFKRVDKAELKSSASMINAIKHTKDCDFIELMVTRDNDQILEYVVCEISNDEVPSRNEYGIEYRERIAYVFGKQLKVPRTLALRKTFPETMHQNSTQPNAPKDLCLYEEDESVTLVNWTPERHIRRTKWWLVQASIGKLHADDQAVEQLLFVPSATIVVPSDLGDGLKQQKKIYGELIPSHEDDDNSLFIEAKWVSAQHQRYQKKINLLEVVTPEVTHGRIYSPPYSCSDLTSLMTSLGVDFINLIRSRLLEFLRSQEGDLNAPVTVFILTIPIRRAADTMPEREQTMGFFCSKTIQELLFDFEIVVKENRYPNLNFQGELFPFSKPPLDINIPIQPMEVLKKPTNSVRRAQSGYPDTLKQAMLVGAGALGGCLHDIWSRGAWGQWTIVDSDIFRPHNFTRHIVDTFCLGRNKAVAIARIANMNFDGLGAVAIADNACNFSNEKLKAALSSAELVVDASASLEYPREASTVRNVPRHLSAFFTPNGNDAVLLVEDKRRKTRLNSLEAQYYRALLENPVGEKHLTTETKRFRSGVSCRDISTVMSHARVLALSSLLADQIRLSSEKSDAQIRIWQEDSSTGCRTLTEVPVHKIKMNQNHTGSEFKVFWDEGIEAKVRALRQTALPNETGGILVGYHDMVRKCVFIVDALSAPPDSVGTPSSFERGTEGVLDSLELIRNRTANNVSYIGEWHSHPDGISANMSSLDQAQLTELATNLSGDGLPAYQMIVAKQEIKVHERRGVCD